jgi:hypothetical protein
MAPLKLLLALSLLAIAAPAWAGSRDRWAGEVAEASRRFGLPEAWIHRVIEAESGGRTLFHGRRVVSRAGAMGLMQLMPGTWREMRIVHRLGPDPHDPRDNILAGTAYLRAMYDRFGYPGLFAAYNAGPARYADHLATGRRLPGETRAYVARIAGVGKTAAGGATSLGPPGASHGRRSFAPLFALRKARTGSSATAGQSPRRASGLFVSLPSGGAAVLSGRP